MDSHAHKTPRRSLPTLTLALTQKRQKLIFFFSYNFEYNKKKKREIQKKKKHVALLYVHKPGKYLNQIFFLTCLFG